MSELQAVSGPSALGGGWRRSLELLLLMSVTNFKKTYFGTVLGYLWSLARPLMLFGVLLAVFTHVFHLGSRVPHYPVFLLFDIVLFGFFQEATTLAVGSIVGYEGVVRKTQFPRLVIPLSVVVTGFFNLSLNLVVAFIFVLAFGITPSWTWLLVVPLLAVVFVITTAVAMIVSSLFPRFRDVQIIWSVLATVLFYATPVLYPIWAVSHTFRNVIALNPLAPDLHPRPAARDQSERPVAVADGGRRSGQAGRGGGALRRDLRARGLAVPPRGAADRRGAVGHELAGEDHRHQRHRRHLPVPIEWGVGEVDHEPRDRARRGDAIGAQRVAPRERDAGRGRRAAVPRPPARARPGSGAEASARPGRTPGRVR